MVLYGLQTYVLYVRHSFVIYLGEDDDAHLHNSNCIDAFNILFSH